MGIPIQTRNDVVGVEVESTEGTYVAPSADTSYVRVLEEGLTLVPARENLERSVITGNLERLAPVKGMKSVKATFGIELRGSGTEGGEPDHHELLKNALGATRAISTTTTAKNTSHSSTVINIEDADISKFNLNDIVVVKESGEYAARPISAINSGTGTAAITFPFALEGGAPANTVVVSKSKMYLTADSGHTALSISRYIGNEKRYTAVGCKVQSMSLENFVAGQLASLKFELVGLGYGLSNAAAPHTPVYDSVAPIVGLKAYVYRDGVALNLANFSLQVQNTINELTDVTNENGKKALLMGKPREISGTMNPYMDDASTDVFDDWNAGTEISIFAYGYVPSSTPGEFTMGSVVAFWIPNAVILELGQGEVNGLHTDEISWRAVVDPTGVDRSLYMGLI